MRSVKLISFILCLSFIIGGVPLLYFSSSADSVVYDEMVLDAYFGSPRGNDIFKGFSYYGSLNDTVVLEDIEVGSYLKGLTVIVQFFSLTDVSYEDISLFATRINFGNPSQLPLTYYYDDANDNLYLSWGFSIVNNEFVNYNVSNVVPIQISAEGEYALYFELSGFSFTSAIPEPPPTPEFEPAEIPSNLIVPSPSDPPEYNGNTWVVDASGSGDFLTINEAVNSSSVVTGDIIDLRNDDNSGTTDYIAKGLKVLLNGHSINMLYFGSSVTSLISNGTIETLSSRGYIFVYDCNIESLRLPHSGSHQIIFNSYIGTFAGAGSFASLYVYNSEINSTGLYISANSIVLFENVEFKQPFSFTRGELSGGNIWLIRNYGADVNISLDTFNLYFINNRINITVTAGTIAYDTGYPETLKWVIDATGAGDFLTIQEAIESPAVISGDIIDLRNDDAGRIGFTTKALKYLLNGYTINKIYDFQQPVTGDFSVYENGTINHYAPGFNFIFDCHIKMLDLQWSSSQLVAFNSIIDYQYDTHNRGYFNSHYYYNCQINAPTIFSNYNTGAIILYDDCEFTQDFSISSTHTTPRNIYFINCVGQNLTVDCPVDTVYLLYSDFSFLDVVSGDMVYPESFNYNWDIYYSSVLPVPLLENEYSSFLSVIAWFFLWITPLLIMIYFTSPFIAMIVWVVYSVILYLAGVIVIPVYLIIFMVIGSGLLIWRLKK